MKKMREKVDSTIGFSGSATSTLNIGARSFLITGILLNFEFVYDTGASTTTANISQDIPWRGILAMSLMGGGRNYLSVSAPDARTLYWATRLRLNGRNRFPTLRTTASQAGMSCKYTLPILFGTNPIKASDDLNSPGDTTAAVVPDSDLTFSVTWGAAGSSTTNSIWGANYGCASTTTLRLTLLGYVPTSAAEEPRMYPAWRTSQWAPTQTYSGLGGKVDLDTGYFYRRSAVVIANGSTSAPPADYRTDSLSAATAVSEVGLQAADGRKAISMKTYEAAQLSQAGFLVADDNTATSNTGSQGTTAAYMTASVAAGHNPGVVGFDYVAIADTSKEVEADPTYGLNLMTKNTGVARLVYTVDASTNTTVNHLHECYLPY